MLQNESNLFDKVHEIHETTARYVSRVPAYDDFDRFNYILCHGRRFFVHFLFFLLFATNVPIATVMENEMEIHLQTKMMMMMTSSNELDISERNFTFFSLLLYF